MAAWMFAASMMKMPVSGDSLGHRKENTATVLLCGTDKDGTRTDTMMLLYLDGNNNRVGLLSLPRDTLTITDSGKRAKLNSAYGRNGCGEEGMEALLDYIQDIIGYRPDGYVLIELPMLKDLIDLFGGVEFHVPQDMSSPDVNDDHILLSEGLQHLDGNQALALLRFRYGYADQDLGRQNVQKNFLKECMKQWLTVDNLGKITDVLELFKAESFTDLETVIGSLVKNSVKTTVDSDIEGTGCVISCHNCIVGFITVSGADNCHTGDGTHQCKVFAALVAGTVFANRQTAVGSADLDVQGGVADGVADLLKGPAGGEHSEGGSEGSEAAGSQAGSNAHHVSFGDAAVEVAVGESLGEHTGLCGAGQVGIQHNNIVVGLTQGHQTLAIAITGGHFLDLCHITCPPVR